MLTLRLNFYYLELVQILYPNYHPKLIGHVLENKQNNKCVCVHEIMPFIMMKMKIKMKKRSHGYDINRPRSRHEHKYS